MPCSVLQSINHKCLRQTVWQRRSGETRHNELKMAHPLTNMRWHLTAREIKPKQLYSIYCELFGEAVTPCINAAYPRRVLVCVMDVVVLQDKLVPGLVTVLIHAHVVTEKSQLWAHCSWWTHKHTQTLLHNYSRMPILSKKVASYS